MTTIMVVTIIAAMISGASAVALGGLLACYKHLKKKK